MMRRLKNPFRRFRKDEDGSIYLIEFVLLVPLVFTLFMTSVEMGMYQIRQVFLDRGLDLTVRSVRLSTGTNYTTGQLRTMICDFAGFLPNCENQLRLEMNPVDPRAFAGFAGTADCTNNAAADIRPNRSFVHGIQHELMLLRACYMFEPVFPGAGLGFVFVETGDGDGYHKMVSLSAFVQEP